MGVETKYLTSPGGGKSIRIVSVRIGSHRISSCRFNGIDSIRIALGRTDCVKFGIWVGPTASIRFLLFWIVFGISSPFRIDVLQFV
jgi:hypothetical protein